MFLVKHSLTNYRNIKSLVFEPSPLVNVICGENGQGKTNLLESVFLLTGGKSFRGARDASLIGHGEDFSVIASDFFSEDRLQGIKIKIGDKGRTASLNKGTEKKASSLVGTFCSVVFSPEHLSLVKGSPNMRRRFIDTALCQISGSYLAALRSYTRLLDQKNSLLKDSRFISAANEMLDVYDAQFAAAACEITAKRRAFIEELLPLAEKNYEKISNGRERLSFKYLSTLFSAGETDMDEALMKTYELRAADLRAGFCTAGPHRDDLLVCLDGEDSKVFASQGQQRCIVLSLKLAEAELMELKLGERPVLLLDDVLSELDASRQDFLIESITDTQAIITCCAPELVLDKTDARVFTVHGGELI
ncbi:MAG: DNA replication/repair protein RecF [Ruminococcaceae bacterium]|nr:DNA replication/repair protein RecF [Oscillospiraceae bacterium]